MVLVLVSDPTLSAAQAPFLVGGEPEILVDAPGVFAMNARWSNVAESPVIAYTSESYRGLWLTNTETGATRQLTSESAAGFGYKWSADGSAILAREALFDGTRRRDVLTVLAVDSAASFQLSAPDERFRSLPEWTSNSEAIVVVGDREAVRLPNPMIVGKTGIVPSESFAASGTAVMRIAPDGSRQEIVSFDTQVLNLSVSPDRRHLAIEVLGGDLYITRADGSGLLTLGKGSRPEWSPDGRFVVFMQTADDGHIITSSELMIGSAEGDVWQLTSTGDVHEMNPSWSADGSRILYDFDGRIFALSIKEN